VTDYLRDRVTSAVGTQYLIDYEIGRGGMAVVYRATDLRLHRPVAIKVLPPDLAFNTDVRTRFLREAETAAQLSHPNIVPIYSVDERDGVVYFVMAFIDGESAAALLAREGPWPPDRVIRVLGEVADALAYAHAHGVVHRDIKPDNILIERATGRALVTDFGIARATAGDTRLTATGVAVGTPAYMSPEQALGERDVDGRSDVYSLGVVGYQMWCGQPPFAAANTPAMLVKHVSEPPRPIIERCGSVPPALAAAIDRALVKRPEKRWSSASEFRDALTRLASNAAVTLPGSAAGETGGVRSAMDEERSEVDRARDQLRALAREYRVGRRAAVDVSSHAPLPAAPSVPPLAPAPLQSLAPYPPPPVGLSRSELRQWYRVQSKLARAQRAASVVGNGAAIRDAVRRGNSLERRVARFRRSVLRFAVGTPLLLFVNAAAGGDPWFLIPSGVLFLLALRRMASIWADGVGPIEAFSKGITAKLRARDAAEQGADPALSSAPAADPARGLVPDEVLAGGHGATVRRAATDRAAIAAVTAALQPDEREMVPDVVPTADALLQRVCHVSTTLHRLEADVSGSSLGALDQRIAGLQSEAPSPDRERRLGLLERQRSTLRDLLDRRYTLAGQLESAALALQNLRLDLLKLQSAGLGFSAEGVSSATQQARAVSRDIGYLIDASDEMKKL
jgi:serine/threonine-protein kinase